MAGFSLNCRLKLLSGFGLGCLAGGQLFLKELGLGCLSLEERNTAFGVNQFLFASKEGVAI